MGVPALKGVEVCGGFCGCLCGSLKADERGKAGLMEFTASRKLGVFTSSRSFAEYSVLRVEERERNRRSA